MSTFSHLPPEIARHCVLSTKETAVSHHPSNSTGYADQDLLFEAVAVASTADNQHSDHLNHKTRGRATDDRVRPYQSNGDKGFGVESSVGDYDDQPSFSESPIDTNFGLPETPPARLCPPIVRATPFTWTESRDIERRQWIYGHHYIRKFLSATVSPGGVGKSSLVLAEILAMVTGRDLLGSKPPGKLRVWYWNGEDPEEELRRRVAAICLHYRITAGEIGDRLFIDSGRTTDIKLATETRNGVTIARLVIEALITTLQENLIDVLVIDPFAACHGVNENDNNKINMVVRECSMIADTAGCAVELVHHSRKLAQGQAEVAVEDARGASALIAAARSARVLNPMTKEEGLISGVTQPRTYFRVDNGKLNLARPPEGTTWYQLVSVGLGNGSPDQPEDEVGVVVSWAWPNPMEGVSEADIRKIQERIDEGEWRENQQADQWAGRVIAGVLGLDLSNPTAKAKAKALLKTLKDRGALKVVKRKDRKGRDVPFVEVGEEV
jgi:hypothetical protein